jgi:SWI/SNF related-matrix-associated actin-dependent regulator of chromatin subfamily C
MYNMYKLTLVILCLQAAFLTGLVEHENIMTSCHRSSLKAMSKSSPALQLAIRHCFILEDPPADDVSDVLPSSARFAIFLYKRV